MSGEKRRYVSIEEQELRRLREQDSRLRSLQQDLPERLNTIRQEAQRELQQRLAPLEERSLQQEQEAQRLKSNIASLERDTHRRLQQQRRDFQAALREAEARQQDTLQAETQRLEDAMREGFAEQRSLFLRITAEQREEYLTLNQSLDLKFSELIEEERQARQQLELKIEQEKQDKLQLAQDWLHDVELIWQQIDQNYQHERFAPNKLADLKRGLDLARNNVRSGVPETALGMLQQTYLGLSDLRMELEQRQQEWEFYYSATLEDLRQLIQEVQANRECEVEIGQGDEAEKFRLEVDYWTNGCLNRYEQDLRKLETRLRDEESTLTTETIQDLAKQIEDLRPCLEDIVEQARDEILSSQLRAEIADKVAEVLGGMGYILVEPESNAIYEGGDQRRSYVLKLQDANQGEVVTIISPEGKTGENLVSINSFGSILQDEAAMKQNADALTDALKEVSGIAINREECLDRPRSEYQDMNAVLNRSPQAEQASQQAGQQGQGAAS